MFEQPIRLFALLWAALLLAGCPDVKPPSAPKVPVPKAAGAAPGFVAAAPGAAAAPVHF